MFGVDRKKTYFFLTFFISVWLGYGLLISKSNIQAYYLQHRGAKAVGEKWSFVLEQPGTDTFIYKGRYFANKQPGQFAISGVVYYILRFFGLSYNKNYILTGALVTWFASSIFAAGSVTLIYLMCINIIKISQRASVSSAIVFAYGTTYGAYGSILHHDIIAGFFPLLAMYLIWSIPVENHTKLRVFIATFIAILTLSISTLYSWSTLLLLTFIFIKSLKHYRVILLALVLGMVPWFSYNYFYFDNLLVTAMHASKDRDSLGSWSIMNMPNYFYQFFILGELSIIKYRPVVFISFFGLISSKLNFTKILLILAVGHLSILLILPNAHWYQQCQYGPRYLFPFMCYAACGLGLVFEKLLIARNNILLYFVLFLSLISVFVNLIGAVFGTMNCGAGYAVYKYFSSGQISIKNIDLPLLEILILPFLISLTLAFYFSCERTD